jgi:hypothetical protein
VTHLGKDQGQQRVEEAGILQIPNSSRDFVSSGSGSSGTPLCRPLPGGISYPAQSVKIYVMSGWR